MKHLIGSCTAGCGACCRRLTVPIPSERAYAPAEGGVVVAMPTNLSDDQRAFYDARGLRFFTPPVPNGGEVAFVPTTGTPKLGRLGTKMVLHLTSVCPHLTTEGLCDVHGTEQQPRLCQDGPTVPEVLHILRGECSFEVVDDG